MLGIVAFDSVGFGRRLKAARVLRGMSVAQVARELDISDEAIYSLERGDRKTAPQKATLHALASLLEADPAALLEGGTPTTGGLPVEGEVAELISTLRSEATRMAVSLARLEELLAGRVGRPAQGEPQ